MSHIKPSKTYSILKDWWSTTNLTNYEKSIFNKEIVSFNQQLIRFKNRKLRIGVFGKAGVGKSTILNSILNNDYFKTGILNGSTKEIKTKEIYLKKNTIKSCELIDYPGFDICNSTNNNQTDITELDLIIFIIAGDPNRNEIQKLTSLINNGKKLIIIFNKVDTFTTNDIKTISLKIKKNLPLDQKVPIFINANKNNLKEYLFNLFEEIGENLLIVNTFQLVEKLIIKIKENRLIKRKKEAQTIIGKFATIKASTVALNPLILIDMAGSFALDTVLIKELSKIYGLRVKSKSARKLIEKISINNFFLGATQIGINLSFNFLKKISLIAAPFTSGLSLVPYGPVAIVQAALAVKATKLIGKLAAKEILKKSNINGMDPLYFIKAIHLNESKIIASNRIFSYNKKIKNDLSIYLP